MIGPTPDEAAAAAEAFLGVRSPEAPDLIERIWADRAYELNAGHLRALLADRKQLLYRLENPCDGEDCETGGAGHCHRCAEAEADKLLVAVKRVRELVAWGVPIGPETLQRALDGVLEAPGPLNLPTYAWGESVTWSNGRILVPLNLADATVADMELDEDGARTLADMLTDAARSRPPDCARCHDRGYVPDWSRGLDAEFGEPGKKPCPDCQGVSDA